MARNDRTDDSMDMSQPDALQDELAQLAQDGPMTSARLASILRTERARRNMLLERVGLDRMEAPGVEGTWSVKELVAHLTWYERAVVDGARQVMGQGTYTRPADQQPALTIDERNAHIAAENHTRPVRDVLAEAEQVFNQLLAVVEACPDDLLNDPQRVGRPDEITPWMLIANNSFAHFRHHEPAIRTWLDKPEKPDQPDRTASTASTASDEHEA